MAEVTVGVRYCGGCNPRFDRVAGVEALARACPSAGFRAAEPGREYGVLHGLLRRSDRPFRPGAGDDPHRRRLPPGGGGHPPGPIGKKL